MFKLDTWFSCVCVCVCVCVCLQVRLRRPQEAEVDPANGEERLRSADGHLVGGRSDPRGGGSKSLRSRVTSGGWDLWL